MASEDIGGVSISVNVDLSDLDAQFQAAVAEAASDGQKIGQAIADGINAGASGADAFQAALDKLVQEGSSANDAFQKLTGSTQTFVEALQSGALNDFADNFGKIASEAQAAAPAIQQLAQQMSLFSDASSAIADATGQMNLFSDAINVAAQDSKSLAASLEQTTQSSSGGFSFSGMFSGAQEGISSVTSTLGQLDQATVISAADFGALGNTLASVGGIALGIGGFKMLATDMMDAYDSITKAQISLTALTGDAGQAQGILSGLAALGMQDGLSMPGLRQAAVSMEAILPAGTDLVSVLGDVANAAAVMGGSVDGLSTRLDRIVESGNVSARFLVGFGLNLDDLKQAMIDLGASAGDMGDNVAKAMKNLDPEGRLMVMQEAMQKFQGIAEDVANNTFGGLWQQATNTFDADLATMGQSAFQFGQQMTDAFNLPSISNTINETVADIYRISTAFQVVADAIAGIVAEIATMVGGLGTAFSRLFSGDWSGAVQAIKDLGTQMSSEWKKAQDEVAADVQAGQDKIAGILNQASNIQYKLVPNFQLAQDQLDAAADMAKSVGATIVDVSAKADTLAGHFTSAGKSAALSMAQAEAAVESFDSKALAGVGTVGTLQAAFENASKAISLLAKGDLPLAIQAVQDYNQAMVDAGAKASVLDAGFQEESKLVGQLAKVDLPGAVEAMAALTKVYLDGNAPIALVNAAFADTEKQIAALAKNDLPAAIEMQKDYLAVLENSAAPMNLITQALEAQQKNWDTLAKTNLPAAIQGLGDLAQKANDLHEPMQVVTGILDDMRSKLDALANTDIQAAISGLDKLADEQVKLNAPTQDVTKTLDDERSKLDQLANTDITGAIAGLDRLAQHQIALNQPTQDVTRTLDDERSKLDQLANTDLTGAIAGLDRLAQEQIKLNQPTKDVTATIDDERSKIDALAGLGGAGLTKAISMLSSLADEQVKLNQPTADVTKTLDDERSKLDALANSNLPAAIQGLSDLADQQIKLNQPTKDVTATLDDERAKILELGGSNIPAAVAALQGLIDKQIALKQPIADVLTSLKSESDLIAKLANTDLPAAIAAHQTYLDELNRENSIYIAINAAGAQTVQQQEFQIASQKQLLDSVNAVNLAYGDRLSIEAKIAQEQINLDQAQGKSVQDQILGLEAIRLKQEELATQTHGYADAIVTGFNNVNKAFDSLAHSMADAIVNGKNLGDVLIGVFKAIGTAILETVIQAALVPLKLVLLQVEESILKQMIPALFSTTPALTALSTTSVTTGASMTTMAAAATASTAALASFAIVVGAIAAVVGAIAGIVGDVYLAAIDTKLFHVETSLLAIQNDTANRRKDAWDQFNQMYDRLGEVKNDADTMLATLQAMYAAEQTGGTGGGLGSNAQSDLDKTANNTDAALTALGKIDLDVQALYTSLVSATNSLLAIRSDDDDIHNNTFIIIARLDSVIAAINYHMQNQTNALQQALGQQVLSNHLQEATLSALAGGGSFTPPNLPVPTGPGDRKIPPNEPIGQTPEQIAAQDAARLAAAQQSLAASLAIADRISALQQIISEDNALMNDAIKAGDLGLAASYEQAAKNATAELAPLISATNVGLSQVTTGVTGQILDSSGQIIQATNTGTSFVVTAVGQSAVTISQAVTTGVAASAAAFSAAISGFTAGLTSVLSSWGAAGGGMPFGPGLPSGSGGSTKPSSPYNPNDYLPPGTILGGPAGAGGGGPLGPLNQGPSLPNPNSPNYGGIPGAYPNLFPGTNPGPQPGTGGGLTLTPGTGTGPNDQGPAPRAPVSATGQGGGGGTNLGPTPDTYSVIPGYYTSSSGSTNISGQIPGTMPMTQNQPPGPPPPASGSDQIAQAIKNETDIINSLKSQAAELTKEITAAIALGDQSSAATFQTSLQGVTSSLGTANTYLTEIQSLQSVTAPATVSGLSGVKASADQMALAQKNAQTAVDNLSAQENDLNQQLIVAEAAGNAVLVTSIQTQIGTTNSQLGSANQLLSSIDATVAAGTPSLTHIASNTALTADSIKKAQDNENALITALQTKLQGLNVELINALASGDQTLVTTIEGEIGQTNSALSTDTAILKQIGGVAATIAANTTPKPSNTPASGVGPGSLIGNVAYSGMPLGYGYGDSVPNSLPHFAEGGIMPWTGLAHLEQGEMALPPDLASMLRRMASTPSVAMSFPNPAAGGNVGSPVVGNVVFNVYGGSAAENVRQISQYMKVVSPKMAALSS